MKLLMLPSFYDSICAFINFLIAVSSFDWAKIDKKENIIKEVKKAFFILYFVTTR